MSSIGKYGLHTVEHCCMTAFKTTFEEIWALKGCNLCENIWGLSSRRKLFHNTTLLLYMEKKKLCFHILVKKSVYHNFVWHHEH